MNCDQSLNLMPQSRPLSSLRLGLDDLPFSGEGNGNSFQYSWLENSMDREAWWATVHGVAKSQT